MKKKSHSSSRLLQLEKIGFSLEAEKQRKENQNRKKLNEIKHEQRSLSRKRILTQIDSKKNIEPSRIISVTANKWVIYDFFSIQYIRGYRAHDRAELGVFSKLLVFCTINTLIKKHKLNPNNFEGIVTSNVMKMFPENKSLKEDDILSLNDLLHLMVLDESEIFEVIISANVGAYLHKKHKNEFFCVYDINDRPLKDHLKYFYELVNSYCKLMHLENVKYVESDPNLRKDSNFCSPSDLAKLAIECLNIPLYTDILRKKEHTVKIKYVDEKGHLSQKDWIVFNKFVEHKFIPYVNVCRNWEEKQFLSSHCVIQYDDEDAAVKPVVIVLMGSYSPKDREKDIQQIVEWYLKSENLLKDKKKQESLRNIILKTEPVENADSILNKKLEEKLSLQTNLKYDLPKFTNSRLNEKIMPIQSTKRLRRIINIKTEASQE